MVPAPDRFRALFEAQAAYVLGRLSWLGVPARDRPDVAQEVFVKVARHLHRLDASRPVRPWLLTIACNAARDYHRSGRIRRERLDGLEREQLQEDRLHDHYDAAALVRRLLSALSYEDREVLVLVDLDERSIPEAASILGARVKAIESRLARARERLAAAHERMRAADRRRIGAGAALPAVLSVDELVQAARSADEDMSRDVAELRARLQRVLHGPPAPARAAAVAPTAAWLGLAAITACATFGLVDAIAHAPAPLPDCVPAMGSSSHPTAAPATSTSPAPPPPAATVVPSNSARTTTAPPRRAPAEASEAEIIALARRAVLEGAGVRALALLRRHEKAYPHGVYAAERAALLRRVSSPR